MTTQPAMLPIKYSPHRRPDVDHIKLALSAILRPGQVVELRALEASLGGGSYLQTVSGYFDDPAKLAAAAAKITSAKAVYFTPNEINPALLSRAANRIRAIKKEPLTSDHDVVRRRYLLIDIDAIRPAGISASDAEHETAILKAIQIRDDLRLEGWHDPIVGDSSNGGHLLYRIDVPADDDGLIERALNSLAKRYDDPDDADVICRVDQSVFNPARIWKLYGCYGCKGDSTADRPHRIARVLEIPEPLVCIPLEMVEELAGPAAAIVGKSNGTHSNGRHAGQKFDLQAWLSQHRVPVGQPESWHGSGGGPGTKWVFDICPWNSDHTNRSAWVAQRGDGAITAGCRHDGCKSKDWHALRAMYEPSRPQFKASPAASIPAPAPKAIEPPRDTPHPFVSLDWPISPTLPDGIFRGWFGDMVRHTAIESETPTDLAVTFGLGATSAAVQGKFRVKIRNGYIEPTNIWTICPMDPGNRKTAACERMIEPLDDWEATRGAEYITLAKRVAAERKTAEMRIAHMRKEASKLNGADYEAKSKEITELEEAMPPPPVRPLLYSDDITPEHAGTVMDEQDGRLALISDEGAGVFEQMLGRYTRVPNYELYLKGHAGSTVKVDRGSRKSISIPHPSVVLALSPQPVVIRSIMADQGMRGRGFLARFAWMLPTSRLGFRAGDGDPVPDDIARTYREMITLLADTKKQTVGDREMPHLLYLSPEALAEWESFWREVEEMMRPAGRLANITDWGAKLPGLVARVAALLHIMDHATIATSHKEIDVDCVLRAVMLGRYWIDHAINCFTVMSADPAAEVAKDIWRHIQRLKAPQIALADAWRPLKNKYKAADIGPGIDVLIDHGYLLEPPQNDETAPRRRGRPPSRIFNVNPAVLSIKCPDTGMGFPQ